MSLRISRPKSACTERKRLCNACSAHSFRCRAEWVGSCVVIFRAPTHSIVVEISWNHAQPQLVRLAHGYMLEIELNSITKIMSFLQHSHLLALAECLYFRRAINTWRSSECLLYHACIAATMKLTYDMSANGMLEMMIWDERAKKMARCGARQHGDKERNRHERSIAKDKPNFICYYKVPLKAYVGRLLFEHQHNKLFKY